uniref:Uncharacterized protein n=1 Tax=Physcomitrium patens TaxID=3218 RepID=A0A2K1KSN7_PHYPA|nr:hypothetical protein PHYPA_003795 [Physcomitrium patens]
MVHGISVEQRHAVPLSSSSHCSHSLRKTHTCTRIQEKRPTVLVPCFFLVCGMSGLFFPSPRLSPPQIVVDILCGGRMHALQSKIDTPRCLFNLHCFLYHDLNLDPASFLACHGTVPRLLTAVFTSILYCLQPPK